MVEYEVRRRTRDIAEAERLIGQLRRQIDGVIYRVQPIDRLQQRLDWWTAELARLEERLRVLLDDEVPATGENAG